MTGARPSAVRNPPLDATEPEGREDGGYGIPVEVPGLSLLIPRIPAGSIIVAESGPDPAKSHFVRTLGLAAYRTGRPVVFLTSRDQAELRSLLLREGGLAPGDYVEGIEVVERDSIQGANELPRPSGLLAVDSFSLLTLDLSPARLVALLRDVRGWLRARRAIVVLATDRGIAEPRSEAITAHLSDGVIQFHSKETAEGVARYLRIPKWMNSGVVDQNIHYDFDGKRIAVDMRRRVL